MRWASRTVAPPSTTTATSARSRCPIQRSRSSPTPRTPGDEQFALAAELLALLGNRTRLTLLHALAGGEADVGTLTEVCGAARPAVSQHLARLRLAGLVATRKEGRRVVYSLRDGHLRRLVDEALNVADHRLSDRPPHG
ncbi:MULTISPECIES: ArsR/SmtB family transcription factor [Streptomyces]|uniref:ArsR/SmtB family transcription factor n=1 Tax=Streptomyces TaxID=1883 RepID=UPI000ACE6202|nr:metalloregulator ArsR/SmtB family transcription factor [Streptomyces prasinus]